MRPPHSSSQGRYTAQLNNGSALIGVRDLSEIEHAVEGPIQWPDFPDRIAEAQAAIAEWFTSSSVTIEEPFVGGAFNATPVRLIACTPSTGSLALEFDAMWDVIFTDIHILDATSEGLAVLSSRARLTLRNPEVSPSISQLERIPFRWMRS